MVGFGRVIEACFFFFSSASALDRAIAFAMISSSLIVVFVGSCCFPVFSWVVPCSLSCG